jgi:hypothetical protein
LSTSTRRLVPENRARASSFDIAAETRKLCEQKRQRAAA